MYGAPAPAPAGAPYSYAPIGAAAGGAAAGYAAGGYSAPPPPGYGPPPGAPPGYGPPPGAPPVAGGYGGGAGYGGGVDRGRRQDALREIAGRLELSPDALRELQVLEAWDIVFVADDSGSMASAVATGGTRWDELCRTVEAVAEIASCLDEDGLDLYFLNNGVHKNLTSKASVASVFARVRPGGYTPLEAALRKAMDDRSGKRKPALFVIATDGQPTDAAGRPRVSEFKTFLKRRPHADRSRISILAVTDQAADVAYLDRIDTEAPYVDVNDDFNAEAAQVFAKSRKRLTRGDYVAKCLLGPISSKWDGKDEKKGDCCVV